MFQACRRRKPDVKKVKRVDLRAFYFLRRLQKSGPTQGPCCSTVYFPIVIENIFQTVEKHNYLGKYTVLHAWDHFFGGVGESRWLANQRVLLF